MGSAGVSVWAPPGILSFYPAASAPRHHRQLRWLNPISAEIAEPFPRLWRGDCLADWGQTIAGCPGRLRAAHSSRSAQIPKPSQWEVNQLLTVFHKQFSSCFLNYKTIRFFFLYNNHCKQVAKTQRSTYLFIFKHNCVIYPCLSSEWTPRNRLCCFQRFGISRQKTDRLSASFLLVQLKMLVWKEGKHWNQFFYNSSFTLSLLGKVPGFQTWVTSLEEKDGILQIFLSRGFTKRWETLTESVWPCHASPRLTISSLCLTIPIYFGSCELWWSRDAQATCTFVFPDADHTVHFRPSALDHGLRA